MEDERIAAAIRGLGECIAATGKALTLTVRAICNEYPEMAPSLVPIMGELIRDLDSAALLFESQ